MVFLTKHPGCEQLPCNGCVDTSGTRVFLESSYASLHRQDLSDCGKAANFPLKISLCLSKLSMIFFFFHLCLPPLPWLSVHLWLTFSVIVIPNVFVSLSPLSFLLEIVTYAFLPFCIFFSNPSSTPPYLFCLPKSS